MAYCKKCGAYIPDGESKCLACGYDENEKHSYGASSASGSAQQATYRPNTDDSERFKQKMDEAREKQRENNRKWAEAERERRRQQEESRRRAETSRAYDAATRSTADSTVSETSRKIAMLSYLGCFWLIPMLFFPEDKFVMYHAKQGLILSVASLIGAAIGELLHIGWVITLAKIFLIIRGMTNASNRKTEPLPYIGDIISKI